MTSTVEDIGPCRKKVQVTVPTDRIAAEFDKTYAELRKTIAEEADETELVEAADSLLEALDSWQKSVSTPERETFQDVLNFAPEIDSFLVNVYQAADSAVLGLTRGQTDRLDDLRPVWQEAIAGWDKLMAEALPAFNRVAGPAVAVPELDQP